MPSSERAQRWAGHRKIPHQRAAFETFMAGHDHTKHHPLARAPDGGYTDATTDELWDRWLRGHRFV